jgi:hypothetical protein
VCSSRTRKRLSARPRLAVWRRPFPHGLMRRCPALHGGRAHGGPPKRPCDRMELVEAARTTIGPPGVAQGQVMSAPQVVAVPLTPSIHGAPVMAIDAASELGGVIRVAIGSTLQAAPRLCTLDLGRWWWVGRHPQGKWGRWHARQRRRGAGAGTDAKAAHCGQPTEAQLQRRRRRQPHTVRVVGPSPQLLPQRARLRSRPVSGPRQLRLCPSLLRPGAFQPAGGVERAARVLTCHFALNSMRTRIIQRVLFLEPMHVFSRRFP